MHTLSRKHIKCPGLVYHPLSFSLIHNNQGRGAIALFFGIKMQRMFGGPGSTQQIDALCTLCATGTYSVTSGKLKSIREVQTNAGQDCVGKLRLGWFLKGLPCKCSIAVAYLKEN